MKLFIPLFLSVVFLSCVSTIPHQETVPTGLTDIANMFNERGYYKSNAISQDEQEIISDFSGNLMYNIPLFNYSLAGDINFNLNLNYNGSEGHQIFVGDSTSYNNGTYRDYMQNRYNLNYKYSYNYSNRLLNAQNINQGDNTYSTYNTYDKDGNITTLKRYGDNNTLKDDFNYQYYPNTNKIRLVTGAVDQFSFDLNGNTILDDINGNYDIKYDYRNLITELYHKDPASETRPNTYATRYYYDESGNRVRKFVYVNSQINPPSIIDWNNPGNGWVLLNNEFYVKGADGKNLATYQGNVLEEWFVWGNDVVGKLKGDKAYYYYKDHLGSVRVVVDNTGAIVAGYDYDAWGYPLENRNYNGDSIKFKYTGKELDKESFYDYFGARYYDARIANWTSVDPLMEKHFDFSPYNFVLRNPLKLIDPNGAQIESIQNFTNIYNSIVNAKIQSDFYSGLSMVGKHYEECKSNVTGNSTGRLEATGDEMLILGIAELAINTAIKTAFATTTLYRAVNNIELKSIQSLGKYSLIDGVENKYFWTTQEDTKWFIESMKKNVESLKNETFTLTKTKVTNRLLKGKDVYKGSDVSHEFYNIGEETLNKFKKNSVLIEY